MKKLFVSDVDQTLLAEGQTEFSNLFKSTVKTFVEQGDHFVLCSGRPTQNLIEVAQQLRTEGINLKYVAGYNGVEIYDLDQEQVIVYNGFDVQEVTDICNYLDSKDYKYMIYDQSALKTNVPEHHMTIRESEFTRTPITEVDSFCPSPKVLVVVDPEQNKQHLDIIKADLPMYEVFNSMLYFVEIVKKGINKSTALKEIAKLETIEHQHTFGFGDGGNDIALIEYANTGVAVANGGQDVKEVADVVIGSVFDDSVAQYLDNLLQVEKNKNK